MESKSVDAMIVDPPVSFVLLKKGFNKVLDIGAAVEMPVGGLTTLTKTLDGKPDQVRRVIKALQQAKESLIGSRERSVGFIVKTMSMEPEIAVKTFDLMAFAWAGSGVPTRSGMENIVKGIQSQGRFADRKSYSKKSPSRASRCKSRESSDKRNRRTIKRGMSWNS